MLSILIFKQSSDAIGAWMKDNCIFEIDSFVSKKAASEAIKILAIVCCRIQELKKLFFLIGGVVGEIFSVKKNVYFELLEKALAKVVIKRRRRPANWCFFFYQATLCWIDAKLIQMIEQQ